MEREAKQEEGDKEKQTEVKQEKTSMRGLARRDKGKERNWQKRRYYISKTIINPK